jgi:hypothetical protein
VTIRAFPMEITDWYGDDVAGTCDDDRAGMSTPDVLGPQLDVLKDLAGGGSVLEPSRTLGIASPIVPTRVSQRRTR